MKHSVDALRAKGTAGWGWGVGGGWESLLPSPLPLPGAEALSCPAPWQVRGPGSGATSSIPAIVWEQLCLELGFAKQLPA